MTENAPENFKVEPDRDPNDQPEWLDSVNSMFDDVIDCLTDSDDQGNPPVVLCAFAVHENGDLTVVAGGGMPIAEAHLAAAMTCDDIRRVLAQRAAFHKHAENIEFLKDLALLRR